MDASDSYWVLPSGEIVTQGGRHFGREWPSNKRLNPNAEEWSPQIHMAPEEDRCLFITFSNRHPISGNDIYKFFTQRYGDILERVYVHRPVVPKEGSETETKKILTAQFGKIIFKICWFPLVVTYCGKRQTKFIVDGKPLWCKKYDPEKAQACKKIKEKENGSSSSSP